MTDIEDRITNLISDAIKQELAQSNDINAPFLNIEDYTSKTGKRFRMTRVQRDAGLTREQAFQQFMEGMMERG
jgi:hypothetical protein|tara:strand:+ start:1451 stop:1669 length:219 start_codon:yes stop_codon:yes gene_type:complete